MSILVFLDRVFYIREVNWYDYWVFLNGVFEIRKSLFFGICINDFIVDKKKGVGEINVCVNVLKIFI